MVHTPTAPVRSLTPPRRGRCVYTGGVSRVNIYLPADLADRVRAARLPVSKICQRALKVELERRARRRWKPQPADNPQTGRRPAPPTEEP